MVQGKTLLIRHLPPNLTDEEKRELIEHFGAIHVKVLSSKLKKSNVVFATFPSEEEATTALQRLHQLDVLGYPLTVEYAKDNTKLDLLPEVKQIFHIKKDDKGNCQKHYENFLHKLNSWHSSVNLTQPVPAHLRYQYPPPSHPVLVNIMRALASVPKFYTQVLHLMNKMNLPSPFHCVFPEPDILRQNTESVPQEHLFVDNQLLETSSSEESEIESEEDENRVIKDVVPMKRPFPHKRTKVKRPKFVRPPISVPPVASKPATKPEEVFETVELETTQRRIALHITPGEHAGNTTSSVSMKSNESENSGGFGFLFPTVKDSFEQMEVNSSEDNKTTETPTKYCITSGELNANRISSRDQKHLPVFKNYQPGIPSCRLYIKNLYKQVDEKDLHYIYSRYIIPECEEQGSMFDIRLMKEGRMKGQAFVTLQNIKQAQLALNQTNGYILKDKPMVVQFARSAMAKTTQEQL